MGYASGFPVRLVAGRLALDFLNTADWLTEGGVAHEKLETLADIAVWMEVAKLQEYPPPKTADEVRAFRSDLRRIFLNLAATNDRWPAVRKVLAVGGEAGVAPDLRTTIALAALSLLLDPREAERIKLCEGDDCGWFFVDESGSDRRRWCSMETCGNRMKARRHYGRKRHSDFERAG